MRGETAGDVLAPKDTTAYPTPPGSSSHQTYHLGLTQTRKRAFERIKYDKIGPGRILDPKAKATIKKDLKTLRGLQPPTRKSIQRDTSATPNNTGKG
jgi:hypothetical protein